MQQFDNICEVQSDKASVVITSRYDGVIRRLHHAVDDIALVGQALVDIEAEGASEEPEVVEAEKAAAGRSSEPRLTSVTDTKKTLATPAVRRIAMEQKV